MTRIKADWLWQSNAQAVCAMLTDVGYQAFFVGGCVRNALIGAPVSDLDVSTDARPKAVMELARSSGFKAVPTGIDHGTITVVVEGDPFEITTFRRDVETDGRRAVVAFADTMEEDAHRRDFTMNALYADACGVVFDPLGGLPDLMARRVRFIDDPTERIKEDYLRILRFFRFYAWYGDASAGLDQDGLAACAANSEGIVGLSKERVGYEMRKLLSAPDPAPALAAMGQSGVLLRVLAGAEPAMIAPLVHVEQSLGIDADAVVRLAALGGDNADDALRLSKTEAKRLAKLRGSIGTGENPEVLGYELGAVEALNAYALTCAAQGAEPVEGARDEILHGSRQEFPITAKDLMPEYGGAALGERLSDLKREWVSSGFALGRDALLKGAE